jgi:importin subunit alpha-6/7
LSFVSSRSSIPFFFFFFFKIGDISYRCDHNTRVVQVINNKGPGASAGGGFKATMNGTEGRKHREETSIQIRKARKEELLRKRRMAIVSTEAGSQTNNNDNATFSTQSELELEIQDSVSIFQKWITSSKDAATTDEEELCNAVKKIRRMLSVDKNPPVKEIIDSGALFFLTELLCIQNNANILFETTWALTNIASTSYTHRVIEQLNLVDRLVPLIIHDSPAVREQSAWCIGNIAGDHHEYRDILLKNHDIVNGLIINLKQPDSPTLLQNICWTISNLCRGKNPQPPVASTRLFLQPLYSVISQSIESIKNQNVDCELHELITDAMWCMTYLSDGDNSRIQIVLDDCCSTSDSAVGGRDIVQCVKEILKLHKNTGEINRGLLIPAVRLLGNIVSGTHDQTSIVVNSGVLKFVDHLLGHPSKALQKEVCWMLSNIAAGTEDHIWSIFQATRNSGLVNSIIKKASSSETINVRKEAIWTISNILTTGCRHQYKILVQLDAIDPLCEILSYMEDSKLLVIAMAALEVILVNNEEDNTAHDQIIEAYGGVEALEKLQEHPSNEVYEKAVYLIEKFFNGIEEENDQNVMPTTIGDTTFEFAAPKQLFPTAESSALPNGAQQKFLFHFGMNE